MWTGARTGNAPSPKGCPTAISAQTSAAPCGRGLSHCHQCTDLCRKGLLGKIKPYGFTLFIRRYGLDTLLDCLERNERLGIVYHREGITGDYDDFDDEEALISFILTGQR